MVKIDLNKPFTFQKGQEFLVKDGNSEVCKIKIKAFPTGLKALIIKKGRVFTYESCDSLPLMYRNHDIFLV